MKYYKLLRAASANDRDYEAAKKEYKKLNKFEKTLFIRALKLQLKQLLSQYRRGSGVYPIGLLNK